MTMKYKTVITGLLAAASLGAIPAASAQDDWNAVVEAARAEGEVVVYATNTNAAHDAVIAAFEDEYGIPVSFVGGRGNEFAERIRTEQIAGRYLGDVTINGGDTLLSHQEAGNLQPHGGLPNMDKATFEGDVDTIVPIYYQSYGILVNTDLVSEEDEPNSWHDLLDPKWKGKIIIDDPRVISTGNARFRSMVFNFGREFEESLRDQEPLITLDQGGSRQRVTLGEYAILTPDNFNAHIQNINDGGFLPIKLVVPEEGVVPTPFVTGMLTNAPNPNAARVFMNFLLSETAQVLYAGTGKTPVIAEGVVDQLPDFIQPLVGAPRLPSPPQGTQRSALELAAEIYGTR